MDTRAVHRDSGMTRRVGTQGSCHHGNDGEDGPEGDAVLSKRASTGLSRLEKKKKKMKEKQTRKETRCPPARERGGQTARACCPSGASDKCRSRDGPGEATM